MAVSSEHLIVPGRGTVFVSAKNAALPSNNPLSDFELSASKVGGDAWTNIGHTSREETVSFERDGGDATTMGSWLDESIRETFAPVTWALKISALQSDHDVLDYAFNGEWDETDNGYKVPGSISPMEVGLFLLMQDNNNKLGFWIPNATVTLDEAPSVDVENFFTYNLRAGILSAPAETIAPVNGKPVPFKIFKSGLTKPAG